MDLRRLPTRTAVAIALLALVPVLTFGILKPAYLSVTVTTVNVVLISSSLFLLFEDADDGHDTHTEG